MEDFQKGVHHIDGSGIWLFTFLITWVSNHWAVKNIGYVQYTTVQKKSIPWKKLMWRGLHPKIGKVDEYDELIRCNFSLDDDDKNAQEDRLVEILGPHKSG